MKNIDAPITPKPGNRYIAPCLTPQLNFKVMIIGVPKEIKNNENRVGMTPAGVAELVKKGHTVYVQATAGVNSGFPTMTTSP